MRTKQPWPSGLAITPMVVGLAVTTVPAIAEMQDVDQLRDPRLADEMLRSRVEKRLRLDDRISWENLKVAVEQGQVTLHGVVKTPEERGLAANIASTIPGIDALINRVVVEPDPAKRKDQQPTHIENETRDRVIEGQEGLKDKQIMP